ncbi:MAG TPA: mechanosensitive ion channel [Syntrophales bacterium]|nr:mechanosensitive ion channel [Syntrophales bacterium]HOX93635.1 mechanosensitive ion channel [Syntrophales bacterium]HPI57832.1 mechanosensitive ion channel [Syntrophales bacterium]HPN25546.1 mechanosensitive ion channel [Syntrophales bacterium]HQM28492.1 mechanosensitive ion channel [Syntrophales bacterium]
MAGLVLVLLSALMALTGAFAAEKAAPAPAMKDMMQAEATYDDPLGRSTPQGTVIGFLKAMQREDYERALDYLNTRQTGKRAQELAVELNHVLNEGLSTVTTSISSKPEGSLQDELPVHRELVGVVRTKKGEHKILLERILKENNPPVWLFSSETLKLVPQIYEEIDIPWIEHYLPATLTEKRVAGYPMYRVVLSFLMIPLAFLVGWLVIRVLFSLLHEPLNRRLDEEVVRKLGQTRKPLILLIASAAVYFLAMSAVSLLGRLFWTFMASTMAVVALMWLAIYVIDVGAQIIEKRRPEAANAVIRLTATLLKALAVIIGLFVIFYYFAGINLTAVVAGLGVGGIAVAFAAQKTIENFFGGVFLIWDKPIRLGDYCKAGEYEGTVEHIGLRSTQIRTLNRTVVSIPNGQLSAVSIENFAMRDRFLFRHTLNLRYETAAEQLRYLLVGIRELLFEHPRVDSTTARVRFVAFGASSLDVEIFAHVIETTFDAFLAVQEDLLLRIIDVVESSGSGFAFPSRTIYMAKDGGLDAEKSRSAADAVRHWRDQGELPFPNHAPARISQLDNTLEYPPKGSALGDRKDRTD